MVGQFDYRAAPFQNVLRQSVVSVAEAALKNGLDNCILDKDGGSWIVSCVLHHHVRGHIAGDSAWYFMQTNDAVIDAAKCLVPV